MSKMCPMRHQPTMNKLNPPVSLDTDYKSNCNTINHSLTCSELYTHLLSSETSFRVIAGKVGHIVVFDISSSVCSDIAI